MNLTEWLREVESFDDHEHHGPVPNEVIDRASRDVGLPFPPQYREFLSTIGYASVGAEEFIGLGGPLHLDVVSMTKSLRSKVRQKVFPASLIPLRADGYGNYDAIDTNHPTSGGEFAIVEWRHEGTGSEPTRVLADSYLEWLESMLDVIRAGGA